MFLMQAISASDVIFEYEFEREETAAEAALATLTASWFNGDLVRILTDDGGLVWDSKNSR